VNGAAQIQSGTGVPAGVAAEAQKLACIIERRIPSISFHGGGMASRKNYPLASFAGTPAGTPVPLSKKRKMPK
jgi:hypothetical protein